MSSFLDFNRCSFLTHLQYSSQLRYSRSNNRFKQSLWRTTWRNTDRPVATGGHLGTVPPPPLDNTVANYATVSAAVLRSHFLWPEIQRLCDNEGYTEKPRKSPISSAVSTSSWNCAIHIRFLFIYLFIYLMSCTKKRTTPNTCKVNSQDAHAQCAAVTLLLFFTCLLFLMCRDLIVHFRATCWE